MSEWFRKTFLYAEIGRNEYDSLHERISAENLAKLRVYSLICSFMMFIISLISYFVTGLIASDNTKIYLLTLAGFLLIYFFSRIFDPSDSIKISLMMYLFIFIAYAFAFSISLKHADLPAVSAIVMLFVVPLIFVDRPINITLSTIIAMIVYIALCRVFKPYEVFKDDAWNTLTYGILAIVASYFIIIMKIHALKQTIDIAYFSKYDLLTGIKNRNSFENEYLKLLGTYKETIACIYADANCLHELNNSKGHEAGDNMLKTIAEYMSAEFGSEHGYRTGGDEFVFFVLDKPADGLEEKVRKIKTALEKKGYDCSFGFAVSGTSLDDVSSLVKDAEQFMYKDKSLYYQQPENIKRRRR